ncbi:hypothetical protein INR49_012307 [Caranx melampygus]|nr:hypothetical protein INR49_012307 [Caranx melampygus]
MLAPESPPLPPSSFPNHLCHTNTPSCPSAARAHDNSQFCDISRGDRLLMTTRGPRIGDITNPLGEDAKQVSSHRGGFESCELGFQPQQPNGYSGQGTEEHDDGERAVLQYYTAQHQCALALHQCVRVTSAGNESHPPIADEDKGTDRLRGPNEAKMLENSKVKKSQKGKLKGSETGYSYSHSTNDKQVVCQKLLQLGDASTLQSQGMKPVVVGLLSHRGQTASLFPDDSTTAQEACDHHQAASEDEGICRDSKGTGGKQTQVHKPADRKCLRESLPFILPPLSVKSKIPLFTTGHDTVYARASWKKHIPPPATDHKGHNVVPLEEEYETVMAKKDDAIATIQKQIQSRSEKIAEIENSLDFCQKEAEKEKDAWGLVRNGSARSHFVPPFNFLSGKPHRIDAKDFPWRTRR